MIANIGYRFTTFADYSMLGFSQENMNKIFKACEGIELIPSVIQELAPEIGNSQRMRFITNTGLSIAIMSNRIDIDILSRKKEGFSEEEICKISVLLLKIMSSIYSAFDYEIQNANRLAWCKTCICLDLSQDYKKKFREHFLKPINFYKDILTDEFSVQYCGRKLVKISNNSLTEENINILTTINKNSYPDGFNEADCYIINFDINTVPENKKNRFDVDSFQSFVKKAQEIQNELEVDFLNV